MTDLKPIPAPFRHPADTIYIRLATFAAECRRNAALLVDPPETWDDARFASDFPTPTEEAARELAALMGEDETE